MAEDVIFPNKIAAENEMSTTNMMETLCLNRRQLFMSLLAFHAVTQTARASPKKNAHFDLFLESLWPSAQAAGVSRVTFDAVIQNLTPEISVLAKPKAQAEFTISIPAYVAAAVTPERIAQSRRMARQLETSLSRARQRHGVPGEMIVAILGLESNFGGATGNADILRVLATLAWKGKRPETFSAEFIDALVMLDKGYAARSQLHGSWAGAMGQPQFMPSAYLKYAESDAGDGPPDIWRSTADAAASVGNFLEKSGWIAELPAILEVMVPESFDYSTLDLDFARWRERQITPADGTSMPTAGAASLYLPAGSSGPAFLITDNFEVIRKYNMSDAYALAVALLAERITGHATPTIAWPKISPIESAKIKLMQQSLASQGFYQGSFDGKLGRASRNAIHAFQINQGINPADGFATKELLARLGIR